MSVRLNGAYPTSNTNGLAGRDLPPAPAPWTRNPSWPVCNAASGSNQIVGLYAVYPGDGTGNGGNFFAMTISGAYTINYGDGTTTNYTSGSTAYYEFNYNDTDLAGTDAPVTLTDADDLVTRTAHGYTNGMTVNFYNIVTTTGLTASAPYYVINATANTFQVSATPGGSAVALTNDGTATLLPYKIATVTITPQVANVLSSVNFFVKHNQSGLVNGYSTGWLDIAIASANIATLTIGGTTTVRHSVLERVTINQLGAVSSFNSLFISCPALSSCIVNATGSSVTSASSMFNGCALLREVKLLNTAATTDMSSMFFACRSLVSVPLFNTAAATNMSGMFSTCTSLVSVPLFNTALVTNMTSMFSGSSALLSVPLLNTASAVLMTTMFSNCTSLVSVPLFNTASVTNMSQMFLNCSSLVSVPLFNTALVTNMSGMFNSCNSLTTVPLFNTVSVTSMATMFASCRRLASVPEFNTPVLSVANSMFDSCGSLTSISLLKTATATNLSGMFFGCSCLTSIPLLNTAAATNMSSMFSSCTALSSVPALVTTAVTSSANFNNMFLNCNALARIQAKDFRFTFSVANCKLSSTALNEIYTNLPTVTAQTITVTGNYGTAGDNPTIATAKGWTVTG